MNEQPLVSIIVPVYNCNHLFLETINKILEQTYKNYEVIIVNDGSTSTITQEILSSLYIYENIKVYSQHNAGVSSARNYGISLAKGEYIAMLDSDDFWHPDTLTDWVAALESNDFAVLAYSGICFINEDTTIIYGYSYPGYKGNVSKQLIEHGNFIASGSNALIRTSTLKKLDSFFDTNLCYAEEWDLFLRLADLGSFEYIDKPHSFYRVYSTSTSSRFDKLQSESYKVLNNAIAKSKPTVNKKLAVANTNLGISFIILSRCSKRLQIFAVPKFQYLTILNKPSYIFNKEWINNWVKWVLFMLVGPSNAKEWKNKSRRALNNV